jgi:hypothetical protein
MERHWLKNPIPQFFGTSFLKKSDFFDSDTGLKIRFFEKIGFF